MRGQGWFRRPWPAAIMTCGSRKKKRRPGMAEQDAERFRRRTGLNEEDYRMLARLPLFAGFSRSDIRSLLADAWVQRFPRNAVLFLEQEPATRFFVVFEGWVKLFRETEAGQESVIGVFAPGESFAEAAVFDSGDYPVSAMTVEDSRLLVIPADSFIRKLRENADYALNVMASVSRHMRRLVQQVERLSVKSSTERVAEFLLRLAATEDGPVEIRLPLDKSLIARRLGMQPETFSRSLARLRALGVATSGARVTIADIGALKRLGAETASPCAPASPTGRRAQG
ncbi:MAG: Crp/Fnr family transcriptional regulator [Alphaproteobacteria bacterium]|nr:MAG: Crp/Fnr family transcriptional regulator [Alphaproteobacteria bacterium]